MSDARDAARYRWLRACQWNESPLAVVVEPKRAVKPGHDCPSLERLDAVIDAALAGQALVQPAAPAGEPPDERAEFEKWLPTQFAACTGATKLSCWTAWQARAALAAPAGEPLRDALAATSDMTIETLDYAIVRESGFLRFYSQGTLVYDEASERALAASQESIGHEPDEAER